MKLVVVAAVLVACGGDKLDRTYLPPAGARSAGGSDLQAPPPGPAAATPPPRPAFDGVAVEPAVGAAPGSRLRDPPPPPPQREAQAAFRGMLRQDDRARPPSGNPLSPSEEKTERNFDRTSPRSHDEGSQQNYGGGPRQYYDRKSPQNYDSPGRPTSEAAERPIYDGSERDSSEGSRRGVGAAEGRQEAERPQAARDRGAAVVRLDSDVTAEGFTYSFETDNGIVAEESADAADGVRAQGAFSYPGDDGQTYSVTYTADENGYRAQGAHLPTPPPIPDDILRSIERNMRDEAAGILDEGTYDAQKYGGGQYKDEVGAEPFQGQTSQYNQYGVNQNPTARAGPSAASAGQVGLAGDTQGSYLPPIGPNVSGKYFNQQESISRVQQNDFPEGSQDKVGDNKVPFRQYHTAMQQISSQQPVSVRQPNSHAPQKMFQQYDSVNQASYPQQTASTPRQPNAQTQNALQYSNQQQKVFQQYSAPTQQKASPLTVTPSLQVDSVQYNQPALARNYAASAKLISPQLPAQQELKASQEKSSSLPTNQFSDHSYSQYYSAPNQYQANGLSQQTFPPEQFSQPKDSRYTSPASPSEESSSRYSDGIPEPVTTREEHPQFSAQMYASSMSTRYNSTPQYFDRDDAYRYNAPAERFDTPRHGVVASEPSGGRTAPAQQRREGGHRIGPAGPHGASAEIYRYTKPADAAASETSGGRTAPAQQRREGGHRVGPAGPHGAAEIYRYTKPADAAAAEFEAQRPPPSFNSQTGYRY